MTKLQKNILNKGLKVTPQRLAVLKYLRENRIHPTAEKVHSELVERIIRAISLTTVYKTLAKFVEEGLIKEVDIDPNKMRFDICIDDHDHFHCRACDNVYDVFFDKKIGWMIYTKTMEIIIELIQSALTLKVFVNIVKV